MHFYFILIKLVKWTSLNKHACNLNGWDHLVDGGTYAYQEQLHKALVFYPPSYLCGAIFL